MIYSKINTFYGTKQYLKLQLNFMKFMNFKIEGDER